MNNNEVRLIDANALRTYIDGYIGSHCLSEHDRLVLEGVKNIIDNAPTVDDWESYSTKLWKEAYERGKAERLESLSREDPDQMRIEEFEESDDEK